MCDLPQVESGSEWSGHTPCGVVLTSIVSVSAAVCELSEPSLCGSSRAVWLTPGYSVTLCNGHTV